MWSSIKKVLQKWNDDDGFLLSAAMAYYATLSLFPLCLVLIAGLGLVSAISPQFQIQQEQVLEAVERNASPWMAEQLSAILGGIKTKATLGGPLGLATLLLAAIGIFIQFENLFERIWRLPKTRPPGVWSAIRTALFDRLVAFIMLVAAGGLVVVGFLLSMSLSAVRPYLPQWSAAGYAWQGMQSLLTIGLNWLLFTLVYKTLPKVRVTWRAAGEGGLLAALVWQIGLRILESLVISDHYTAYGVVGSFMAIMLWMYYASAVVFLGAELTEVRNSAHVRSE